MKRILFLLLFPTVLAAQQTPYGEIFKINSEPKTFRGIKTICLENGSFVVSWGEDNTNGSVSLNIQIYSPGCQKVGNMIRISAEYNTQEGLGSPFWDIASLKSGGFAVVWHSKQMMADDKIYCQLFTPSGEKVADALQISCPNGMPGNERVVSIDQDSFLLIWRGNFRQNPNDWPDCDILGQRISMQGKPLGSAVTLNSNREGNSSEVEVVLTDPQNILLLWERWRDYGNKVAVYAQAYSSLLEKTGPMMLFWTNYGTETWLYFCQSTINLLGNGNALVTWEARTPDEKLYDVFSQVISKDTKDKMGQPLCVNTTTTGQQWYHQAVPLKDGSVLISWHDEPWNTYTQRISPQGEKIGSEQLLVSENLRKEIVRGDLIFVPFGSGRLLLAWVALDQPRANLYTYEFGRIGYEFTPSDLTEMGESPDEQWNTGQFQPLAGGDVVYFWTSRNKVDQSDSWNYYFKLLPPEPNVLELKEFKILEPANDTTILTTSVVARWERASRQQAAYKWEMHYTLYCDDNPSFSHPTLDEFDADTTRTVNGFIPGKTYFMKIRGRNLADQTAWSSNTIGFYISEDATAVPDNTIEFPKQCRVYSNYPNPFNPETSIRFDLTDAGVVVITVYDVHGRRVHTLLNEPRNAGSFSVKWYGIDSYGNPVPSGIYVCRMEFRSADGRRFTQSVKMGLVR